MNKRVALLIVIIAVIAGSFWSLSRYPALDEKASGNSLMEDSLSFEALIDVEETMPLYQRVFFSTINWAYTNKEGMIFGILLATAFMTLMGFLHRHGRSNVFLNAFKGTAIGAPLGVCVNCSAPIAKGMYEGGSSMGTSLAAMFSSPTLNIVVLTMLFSLFPFYIAVTKIALTLFLILLILPVLARYVFKKEDLLHHESHKCEDRKSLNENWMYAIRSTVRELAKNFFYIVKTVVPLMLLAGFLGVVLVTLLPLENLVDFEINLVSMSVVAFIGTFLPIPMAFDVIAVHTLMQAGLKPAFAMILLFTLGIFSVYPLFIISKSMSKRVAFSLFAIVMLLGLGSGYAAQAYDDYRTEKIISFFDEHFNSGEEDATGFTTAVQKKMPERIEEVINVKSEYYYSYEDIEIESIDHKQRVKSGTKPFTRHEGDAFGMDRHNEFSILEFSRPFRQGLGIASGDFNNDGWQDIALATNKGILLYKNTGSKFVLEEIDVQEIHDLGVHVVAFVDIDDDGWQDIYITSYGGKNYFLLNDKNGFQNPRLLDVPNTEVILTEAASFVDIDKDGDLDFVNGNWFIGNGKPNRLIINEKLQFHEKNLKEIIGETLSILFSDFTNDNNPDLIVGNDFMEPDIFYAGDGKGGLRKILKDDGIIPISTHDTMSTDVADFNNDLYMDIYMAAAGPGESVKKDICFEIKNEEERQKCGKFVKIKKILKNKDIEKCAELQGGQDKDDCMVMVMLYFSTTKNNQSLCEKIPETYQKQRFTCHELFDFHTDEYDDYKDTIGQKGDGNVLLQGSNEGIFQEVTREKNVEKGGWSWNAKFADLDNDEWQDIYVANGYLTNLIVESNVFFHNLQGQRFNAEQEEFGLEGYSPVGAYTYIDMDNDGDLDIITVPVIGPLNVYVNNEHENNAITFEFRDNKGNYFGIGNKVFIYYGDNDERHQVREIKSGGGFLSFDAPIAHFGLGKYDKVNKVEVVWSTGEKTILDKEFFGNRKYVITRGI